MWMIESNGFETRKKSFLARAELYRKERDDLRKRIERNFFILKSHLKKDVKNSEELYKYIKGEK